MIKRFIKDFSIYGFTGILSKGIAFFLVPFYTRIFTPNDYGIIDLLAIVAQLVSVTFPLEITQAVARFLADDNGSKRNTDLVSSVGFLFTIIALSLFLLIALPFTNYWTVLLLDDIEYKFIFQLAVINMFFSGLYYFVQNQLRWILKPIKYSIVSITYVATTIPLTILLVLVFDLKLVGVFYAKIAGAVTSFFLGWYFSKENYYFIFSYKKFRQMLEFSLPLVPSSVAVFLINSAQKIFIKALMSLSDLGLYGVGSRLASIINVGFQNVKTALIPIIYQNHEGKNTPSGISKLFNWMTYLLLLMIVSISVFSQEIIRVLTTPAYYSSYILVPFLLVDVSIKGLTESFTPGLAISKKTKIIAILNIFGAIISIGMSYTLIKIFGLIGAAIAVLLRSLVIFIVQLTYSQKYYPIPYKMKKIIFSFTSSIPFIIAGMLFNAYEIKEYLMKLLIVFIYFIVITLGIKMVDYRQLAAFMKAHRTK